MTLETVVTLSAFSIFALCLALYIIRATAASNFRHKIAAPHGFTEGVAHGPAYPLWLLSFGFLFIQVAAFAAFPTSDELSLNKRITVFIINLVIFFILRSKTMPLLAIWFGKTGIWVSHGLKGLIKFENVIYCEILNEKRLDLNDPNAVCVLAIYAKGRKNRFRTEKYVCCISARELEPYIVKLPDESQKKKHSPISFALRILTTGLTAVTLFSSVCFLFATGILSPYKYTEDAQRRTDELKTIAPITDTLGHADTIAVHHSATEIVNVYSETDGTLLWSISRSAAFIPDDSDGISATEGILRYTVGGKARYFSLADGTELDESTVSEIVFPPKDQLEAIDFEYHPLYVRKQLSDRSYRYTVNNPSYYVLFIPNVSWALLIASAILLYVLRLAYTVPNAERRASSKKKSPPPPKN